MVLNLIQPYLSIFWYFWTILGPGSGFNFSEFSTSIHFFSYVFKGSFESKTKYCKSISFKNVLGTVLVQFCIEDVRDDTATVTSSSQWFYAADHWPQIESFVSSWQGCSDLACVDVFGASQAVAKCFKRRCYRAVAWDLKLDQRHDIVSEEGWWDLLLICLRLLLASKRVYFLLLLEMFIMFYIVLSCFIMSSDIFLLSCGAIWIGFQLACCALVHRAASSYGCVHQFTNDTSLAHGAMKRTRKSSWPTWLPRTWPFDVFNRSMCVVWCFFCGFLMFLCVFCLFCFIFFDFFCTVCLRHLSAWSSKPSSTWSSSRLWWNNLRAVWCSSLNVGLTWCSNSSSKVFGHSWGALDTSCKRNRFWSAHWGSCAGFWPKVFHFDSFCLIKLHCFHVFHTAVLPRLLFLFLGDGCTWKTLRIISKLYNHE